ncbi:MAG: hypothetical protein IBX45_08940 [Campylobacterales bacterium]|nr:hypothetical protein [Campylobacterales bacterium]
MYQSLLGIFLALFFLSGCHHAPVPPDVSLEAQLRAVPNTNADEAARLAHEAHTYAQVLKARYGATSVPRLHNLWVNLGVKDRGLCWHYAHDLFWHVRSLELKSYESIIVVANLGSYWTEHSAVVVTCKGCGIIQGVVLDAWRSPEGLFYTPVTKDPSYTWERR